MAVALKAALSQKVVEELARQVLEDVNNVPEQEDEAEIDDELLDQIAAKMIRDLEAASGSERGSLTSVQDSNYTMDAILKKVK